METPLRKCPLTSGALCRRLQENSQYFSGDYRLKQLNNTSRLLPITTDSGGNAWVFVGADSGYEGQKDLYYTQIKLTFTPR